MVNELHHSTSEGADNNRYSCDSIECDSGWFWQNFILRPLSQTVRRFRKHPGERVYGFQPQSLQLWVGCILVGRTFNALSVKQLNAISLLFQLISEPSDDGVPVDVPNG